jgi:hemolysin activation/secretion protein
MFLQERMSAVKTRYSSTLFVNFLVFGVCRMVSAQGEPDVPAFGNDPTRAQQVTEPVPILPADKQKDSLALPNATNARHLNPAGSFLTLNKIIFEGNSVFDNAELDELTASYLHRNIYASELEEIRLKVSRFYVEHGYVNSGAVLNSQSVKDGVLILNIVEGRLTDVRQTGQGRLPDFYIKDRLIDGSGEPLNTEKLQDAYRRLLSDPLIQQLNGRLLPGVHPGEAVLDLQVTRHTPYQLYAGADDYSTPAVGGYTGRMGGWVDNLLTLGERIDAQYIVNGGGMGYNTGISIPVNASNTRLSFRYSDIKTSLTEAPFNALNISSRVVGFDGGISQPVYQTFADNLALGLNFVVRQSETYQANSCASGSSFTGIIGDTSCASQVTVLRMSQRASHRSEQNNVVFNSTFNAGLNALGATTLQAGGQSGQFFSWLGQSLYSYKFQDSGIIVMLKGNIQLSDSALLPLERYSIGGVYTVRGYRENTYIRDNGFNTNFEIKYPLPSADLLETSSLYLVPFLDYGGAWNNSSVAESNPNANYLFSTGMGFNWQYRHMTADFYWAHAFVAVNPAPVGNSIQDNGVHFRVNFTAF